MHDSPTGIEARLRACEDALAALTRRISTLEGIPDTALAPADQASPSLAGTPVTDGGLLQIQEIDYASILSLAGRTCVVFGGAFLLRALTDAGTLPGAGGIGLGFVYATAWFGAADSAGRRRPVSALFHGLAAVLIGLPLVWEAAMRFHLLTPAASALALAGLTALALAVAWHRDLPLLAGIAAGGGVVTAVALGFATGAMLPHLIFLIALSGASSWLSDARHWAWLKWPAVLAATVCLVAAPLVGGAGPGVIRASFVVFGGVAYGIAFFMRTRHPQARPGFYYYATLGLVMAIWGSSLELAGTGRDVMFTALAVASTWLATRTERSVLAVHSAVYAVAAAMSAGLIACSLQVWFTRIAEWPAFPLTGWLVLVAALPGGLIPRAALSRRLDPVLSMSRLALAIVLVGSLAGLIVLLLGPTVAGTPPDPGRLASLKTVVLSGVAVALALVRRRPFGGELGWLAYPVMIAGGLKLLVEDLRVSSPSTLFIALAVYGTALLLTARIARRPRPVRS